MHQLPSSRLSARLGQIFLIAWYSTELPTTINSSRRKADATKCHDDKPSCLQRISSAALSSSRKSESSEMLSMAIRQPTTSLQPPPATGYENLSNASRHRYPNMSYVRTLWQRYPLLVHCQCFAVRGALL